MKILLLNQTFYPDVMATGQYLAELAAALAEKGHEVTVVTGRRAYDDPEKLFSARETWRGVRIFRAFSTRFGKRAKWRRAVDFASFIFCCCARLACLRRQDVVVALTTPPLISFIGAWRAKLWRARFYYWVMDLNPDEAVAAGWLRADSLAGRMLERMSRFSLQHADRIIALDRFMRDRITAKGIAPEKIAVIPPWSHDSEVRFDAAGREQFRAAHGLKDKFVVMYSGNHSPVHPLDTLMRAAEKLRGDASIAFCFVGGGSEFKRVQRWAEGGERTTDDGRRTTEGVTESGGRPGEVTSQRLHGPRKAEMGSTSPQPSPQRGEGGLPSTGKRPNVLCLPYQPLNQLAASLSAADAHVVVMGEAMLGLVHPCKIYNILAVGAPVIYIGPKPSHVTEILDRLGDEYPSSRVMHGEADLLADQIQRLRQSGVAGHRPLPGETLSAFSQASLLPRLAALIEGAAGAS